MTTSWKADFASSPFILYSLGPAQFLYPVVGPTTFINSSFKSAKKANEGRGRKEALENWKSFSITTACLIPFAGGLLAAKVYNK